MGVGVPVGRGVRPDAATGEGASGGARRGERLRWRREALEHARRQRVTAERWRSYAWCLRWGSGGVGRDQTAGHRLRASRLGRNRHRPTAA